jgi:predicted transcriptional regulator
LRRERRNIAGRASRGLLAALGRNGNVARVSFSSRVDVDATQTTYLTDYLSTKAAVMSTPLSPEVARLLEGKTTVAAKIRALAAAGYPRADIARMLGKRYQHVRNVLEEPGKAKAAAVTPEGMAESDAGAFVHDRPKTYRLEVKNGSVTIPPEVLEALGGGPNGLLTAELDGEFFKLISIRESVRRIQELLRPYWRPGVSIVDELIADRRREAAEDDREYDERQARDRQDD